MLYLYFLANYINFYPPTKVAIALKLSNLQLCLNGLESVIYDIKTIANDHISLAGVMWYEAINYYGL